MKTKSIILIASLAMGSAFATSDMGTGDQVETQNPNFPEQTSTTPGYGAEPGSMSDGAIIEDENEQLADETQRDIDEAQAETDAMADDATNDVEREMDEADSEISETGDEVEREWDEAEADAEINDEYAE